MAFLAPTANVTFEAVPNETGGYNSLCWLDSRMRESMDDLKDTSGPTTRDDGSVFSSGDVAENGDVTENGEVPKEDIGKVEAGVGGLVGGDIFRITLINGQLTVVNGGKSNCGQQG